MSDPVRLDPERLLAQTAWVRRLALSLSRDESSADDLAQDALAVALRRPPPDAASEGALRAWFASVTRHLAIHRTRSDSRRVERERRAARPELERTQERLRELEELRGELVKHVLTLPEPSQQVVLLAFFEELDSAEIARRLRVPDSTIRNRLRRALAELREKIERKHGPDWRNLCLFTLPTAATKVALGTSAAAAAGGLWLTGGAALLLALALLVTWHPWRNQTLESTDASLLAAVPATVESSPDAPAPSDRASPAAERVPEPIVANTKPFLLFGRVLDARKKPLKSAHLSLTDDRNESFGSQDSPEGWYSFTALAPALYDARIEGDGGAPLTLQLDLRNAAGDTRRDFTLGEISYVQVRFLHPDGTPWPARQFLHGFEREHELCVVATAEAPGKTLGPSTWAGEYAHYGVGQYHSESRDGFGRVEHLGAGSNGVLDVYGPRPVFASLCRAEHVLETRRVDANTDVLDFVLTDDFVSSLAASATALVVDERSGAPAGGVRVELTPSWMGGPSSQSDAHGLVEFHELATGTLELQLGSIWRSVRIDPGQTHDLGSLPWLPERRLRAKILDAEGNPAAADIHCTLDDPALGPEWCALRLFGQTDASGVFEFPEGPGFATTILATRTTPTLQAGAGRLPRGEGQVAQVRLRPAHKIGLHLKSALGERFDVRITDADGLTWAEAGPGWSLVLPEGSYTLSVTECGRRLHQSPFVVDAQTRSVEVSF